MYVTLNTWGTSRWHHTRWSFYPRQHLPKGCRLDWMPYFGRDPCTLVCDRWHRWIWAHCPYYQWRIDRLESVAWYVLLRPHTPTPPNLRGIDNKEMFAIGKCQMRVGWAVNQFREWYSMFGHNVERERDTGEKDLLAVGRCYTHKNVNLRGPANTPSIVLDINHHYWYCRCRLII